MDDEQCSCGGTFHKVYTTRFEGKESVVYQCKCGKMALDPQKEDEYEDWPYLGIYMDKTDLEKATLLFMYDFWRDADTTEAVGLIIRALKAEDEDAYNAVFSAASKGSLPEQAIEEVNMGYKHRRRDSKLDKAKVAKIRKQLVLGETQAEIASQYGVSQELISQIHRGLAWSKML